MGGRWTLQKAFYCKILQFKLWQATSRLGTQANLHVTCISKKALFSINTNSASVAESQQEPCIPVACEKKFSRPRPPKLTKCPNYEPEIPLCYCPKALDTPFYSTHTSTPEYLCALLQGQLHRKCSCKLPSFYMEEKSIVFSVFKALTQVVETLDSAPLLVWTGLLAFWWNRFNHQTNSRKNTFAETTGLPWAIRNMIKVTGKFLET